MMNTFFFKQNQLQRFDLYWTFCIPKSKSFLMSKFNQVFKHNHIRTHLNQKTLSVPKLNHVVMSSLKAIPFLHIPSRYVAQRLTENVHYTVCSYLEETGKADLINLTSICIQTPPPPFHSVFPCLWGVSDVNVFSQLAAESRQVVLQIHCNPRQPLSSQSKRWPRLPLRLVSPDRTPCVKRSSQKRGVVHEWSLKLY